MVGALGWLNPWDPNKFTKIGAPGWLSQLSVVSDFGSGHDLTVFEFELCVGLSADSSEPGACFRFSFSLSLSLALSAPPLLVLFLSKINIKKTFLIKKFTKIKRGNFRV